MVLEACLLGTSKQLSHVIMNIEICGKHEAKEGARCSSLDPE